MASVPGLLPVVANPAAVGHIRSRSTTEARLVVGHFGTYGGLVTNLLEPAIVRLVEGDPRVDVRLLGSGSEAFRESLVRAQPSLQSRVTATGTLANPGAAARCSCRRAT